MPDYIDPMLAGILATVGWLIYVLQERAARKARR